MMFCGVAHLAREWAASIQIRLAYSHDMIFDFVTLLMAKMSVVNVIDVSIMLDRGVSASRTM